MSGVDTGVGASLREARKRRELDLADVEAAIKIRVRYLQAIEDEDWEVLPGDVYARGFIRTYAAHLGLDGERLAEKYRQGAGGEREERSPRRIEPVGSAVPSGRRSIRGRALTAAVVLAVAALLVVVGLTGDGGDESPVAGDTAAQRDSAAKEDVKTPVSTRPGVTLGVTATDEVWVCLLDSDEQAVLDGEILLPGQRVGPFRSERFSAAFGNGAIELTIDGEQARTAASSGPVGYEIDAEGELRPLEEGERPDCA